jgi:carboxylate-amine ligase
MTLREPSFTLGIEEEYLLTDKATRNLVSDPPEGFMNDCQQALMGLDGQVGPEFMRSQVEVGTGICANIKAARKNLAELRGSVAGCGLKYGISPIASSTHPFAEWDAQLHTDKERYNVIAADLQMIARRMLISGMHVHIGIEDDDLRIDIMNQATYFLPHLLALSTSSPFWRGQLTGLSSYRLSIFDELPRTGLPEYFNSYGEYQRTVDVLVTAGLIQDGSKIWWDLRPSARFPTLELRITDVCPLLDDAIAIAALFQCLCRMFYRLRRTNRRWRYYTPFLVMENRWRAQRYGVTDRLVDFGRGQLVDMPVLLDEILELVAKDAEALDCVDEVMDCRRILRRGTSADRQIAVYRKARDGGADNTEALRAVVESLLVETVRGTEVEANPCITAISARVDALEMA